MLPAVQQALLQGIHDALVLQERVHPGRLDLTAASHLRAMRPVRALRVARRRVRWLLRPSPRRGHGLDQPLRGVLGVGPVGSVSCVVAAYAAAEHTIITEQATPSASTHSQLCVLRLCCVHKVAALLNWCLEKQHCSNNNTST